ncbi:beta-lactamase domain protein [Ruminiclostridium papyrosolvens DSM 2782]|uniref:Beta-lactamase domain protein n=1 Tax=Ruminiclostridium papyrosolvens DSM 2782 TaxID=588581 RepID=F1TEB8_9FIRM|nr:MBL fold metallo-hydrolase [Ruminiclostridium papyrosolvens]EGD47084.1 beta-lactamase domain protein [Ruminiclostridium papyrosolvens DSM 2782]WES36026.1 MBL fold metallo-hydrolase [Ruminiclostridium papyrosolvens DSM 2782]WES36124.1 MBL fold metallo-hydrolase [Ruminiclostridium papyrosolvens DSM 2782]
MKIKVVGSSSSGNCYILQSPTGKLIFDCGMPWKDTLKALNFDLSNVVGCLVTHCHKDHSKAILDVLNNGITVLTDKNTASITGTQYSLIGVEHNSQHVMGDFLVIPFNIEHDVPSLGYIIKYIPTGETILFATDTYMIRYNFKGLNYILLETNYCKDTLDKNVADGFIDVSMKKRLLKSHFSLENVKIFLDRTDLSKVQKIVLLHLSDRNSDSDRILREVSKYADTVIAEPGMEIILGCEW